MEVNLGALPQDILREMTGIEVDEAQISFSFFLNDIYTLAPESGALRNQHLMRLKDRVGIGLLQDKWNYTTRAISRSHSSPANGKGR